MDLMDEKVFEMEEASPGKGLALSRSGFTTSRASADEDDEHPNPATFGWPPTLALELAMHVAPTKDICKAYNISRAQWLDIAANPAFIAELSGAVESLRQDGMAFKARARIQAMELLKESWVMIHDKANPPAVRADLLKFTINAAGLNDSLIKKGGDGVMGGGSVTNGFHIQIHLGDNYKDG